jgi:putative addiction module component (TIGR02574 family)
MGAPGHGRVKCAHVHYCGDEADASDPHQKERLQVADAIWDSVVHEVETSPLPEWQRAELQRRLADSMANPDTVRPWGDVEAEALARAKR